MHDNAPRPLATREFEAMMSTLDEAQDWMLNQLRQRQIAQESPHVPVKLISETAIEITVHKMSSPSAAD